MSEHTSRKRFKPVIEEIVPQAKKLEEEPSTEKQLPEEQVKEPVSKASYEKQESVVDNVTPSIASPRLESKETVRVGLGFFALMGFVALTVALISGAFYVYFNGVNVIKSPTIPDTTPAVSSWPTSSPAATPAPTPRISPSPTAKPLELKISVLNGSGKIGEASKVKTLLQNAGFKVAQTGNAASFNYKKTVVQVKPGVADEMVSKIKDLISKNYQIEDGQALDPKSSFDIIITVGTN